MADDVIVVPCVRQEILGDQRTNFLLTCKEFPEFKQGTERYVLGSFGALGNPASFHNNWVRQIRCGAYKKALQVIPVGEDEKFHMLFDRMCTRQAGTTYQGEDWHRDIASNSLPGDKVWGGWINFDETNQVFTCVPGSSDDHHTGTGFSKDNPPPRHMVARVQVPPGYMILFRQNILHCITKTKSDHDSYRLFVGFRTTTSNQPLYDVVDITTRQSCPPLPSGQMPPMFSANHDSCLLYKHTIPWSDNAVQDPWKEERTILKTGKSVRVVPRFIRKGLFEVIGLGYLQYSQ